MISDKLKLKLAIYLVLTGVMAGTVATALSVIRILGPARDRAIALVPKHAALYATVFLEPSTSQQRALRDLLEHFPAAGDLDAAETLLDRVLTDAFAPSGLDYAQEIKPWIGAQVGFFISDISAAGEVDGALLVETEDEEATLAALAKNRAFEGVGVQRASYRGHDYVLESDATATGVVADFLIVGSEPGVRSAIAALEGESLADSDGFSNTAARLNEDRLALFYVDIASVVRNVGAGPGFFGPQLSVGGLVGEARAAIVGYVRSDGIVFESTGAAAPDALRTASLGTDSGWLPVLPGDAWAAFDINELGSVLESIIATIDRAGVPGLVSTFASQQLRAETGLDLQEDLLSWMGDTGVFVRGRHVQRVGPGLVIASSDRVASDRAVKKLYAYLLSRDALVRSASFRELGAEGFSLRVPGPSPPLYVLAQEDRVVVGLGAETARAASGEAAVLGSQPAFARAQVSLGEDFDESGFINLQRVVEVLENSIGVLPPQYDLEIKPNLAALDHVVFGSKLSGDEVIQRLVIGVR